MATTRGGRVTVTQNNALVQFAHLAKHAPTDAARAYWARKADEVRPFGDVPQRYAVNLDTCTCPGSRPAGMIHMDECPVRGQYPDASRP